MLHNIPFELQKLDQWVVATGALLPNGKRDKTPLNPRTGFRADVTDPGTWGTFAEAQQCGYPFVGFVLAKGDPFCIIDLDDPRVDSDGNAEPAETIIERTRRHQKILDAFESYAELSQSGNGIHIICRGAVPHGVRRDKVEVYSDGRYMICTGNVYKPFPIRDCQELVMGMFAQMNAAQPTIDLVQVNGPLADEQVYHMASTAANADKFNKLWAGDWRGSSEWPSQSEADFALLSMLAFYTKDNEQVRRLFRWSGLVRDKSQQGTDGYLNIALRKIRAKELPLVDFTALMQKHQQTELPLEVPNEHVANSILPPPAYKTAGAAPFYDETPEVSTGSAGPATPLAPLPPQGPLESATRDSGIPFPPGFIGEVAEYIYSSAIRPVPEIALVAALGLTAGVAARTYNISGSGLNQYLVLLARTGSGKEGMAKGIDMLVQAVRPQVPMVDQFIGPGAFASGQGALRALERHSCFVAVLGEFGFMLQSLCDPRQNDAMRILKRVLLDVYAKSGFSSSLKPQVYSQTEKDTKVVQAPNITILGESTPESFYDALDAAAIAQGLVPRFSIFEYDGPRPPKNPHAFQPPPKALVDKFAALLAVCLAAEQNRAFCPVQIDGDAQRLLDAFDATCDVQMNANKNDVNLQLWNRAHLKALKLAALVAVGINPHNPIVNESGARWAIELTQRDIKRLLRHFQAGDIGQGDERMESDLRRAIDDYFKMSKASKRDYEVAEKVMEAPVIPFIYLRRRLRSLASFRNHRLGANAALGLVLKSMCESQELQLVPPLQAMQMFGLSTPLYVKGPSY